MTRLTKNERIQVHHNYISAVSSLEHKKDLINRLKRSDTHNIPAYEAEMSRHMTLHEDVLERILNILKQDDYYRTLEDLPVIDELTAYNDIKLFPELYDTSTIIERVTAEADLIEQQLRRPGMYPQHTNLSHPTSNPPKTTPNSQPTSTSNSTKSSPQSSLPCGQRTPATSTSSSDAQSSQTPPQTFANPSHQPKVPTHTQHTSPSPHRQHIKTPLKTNVNQSSQSSIVEEDQQCVPKSADGTRAGVVADLWPNNSIIMRHFFKNNSRIMQTYNYLFVSIISFVNMNNMKITPNATMCSSIISLFLLITLFTVQL